MSIRSVTHIDNVRLRENGLAVVILDQSLLPNETKYLELEKPDEMFEAIQKLRVRGAPAIGICAAYCLYVLAARRGVCDDFAGNLAKDGEYLKSSRPTAVNLAWAVDRMIETARAEGSETADAEAQQWLIVRLKDEAIRIHEEDMDMCRKISEYGLSLIKDGDGVLTHCNAGPLATSRYGTALGPILLGQENGVKIKVFADETRPLLQGARLTAYELEMAGVDVTLICDNMASSVMKKGWIQACFVGC
ncbi:MAG: S-methyl-5-thioribose-1-phosphate isomerase, partial [Eubacterium sp.]|nr:S-methyl-5-thioribose-1-phosphate isomerase [Candidatus Colimonas fimequi]